MRLKDKINIGYRIVMSRLLNRKSPLAVGWSLTNRCNLNCIYCARWSNPLSELDTTQVFSIIDQLKKLDTKIISFTGGEPLLREDIGDIIDYASSNKIFTNINTNGILFLEKANKLHNLKGIKFSLDGPPEVNDYIRGKDVHNKVIEAIKLAKTMGMEIFIVTVLSRYNLDNIDYLVNLVNNFGIKIIFQPSTLTLLDSSVENPHLPNPQKYKSAIDRLILHKKNKMPIFNSISNLVYLRSWPQSKKIFCYGRNIICRIEPDGHMYLCSRHKDKGDSLNCLSAGVKEAFNKLSPRFCRDCWCALRLESNYVASLNLDVCLELLRK